MLVPPDLSTGPNAMLVPPDLSTGRNAMKVPAEYAAMLALT